jgi:hypothetical protein
MSHIQKRADRRYRARWLDPDGRERSRTFARKADAERHLAAVEGAKLSGAYVNDANPVTVGEYARKWAATRPHRQTTATRVESLISNTSRALPSATSGSQPSAPPKSRLGLQTEPESCLRPPCGSWCRLCAQCSMPPFKIA